MKLQTQIPLEPQMQNRIDYFSRILLFGSCFTENMGSKVNYFKFQNLQNPLGILFHPIAIENLISRTITANTFKENDVFFHNEQWHSFEAHSSLSSINKHKLIECLNKRTQETAIALDQATHVVITLGTAWVYKHLETNKIVANCHKVPQKHFAKVLLSVEEVNASLKNTIALLRNANPQCTIIFTVSPVRHLKDGFVENTQSKAHLLTAIHQTIKPEDKLCYFPSYEIMMDELRDYRFYKEDMLHPNQIAVDYIWQHFVNVWFDPKTHETMQQVDTVQKGLQHKPFNTQTKAHKVFLDTLRAQKEALNACYPHITF
ncbi:MAG TPA: GSCFA domain-containing protein [Flavobacteriaceae bacterium]|nr:GSCFA domain-containing protein [Flavobacteriaceae bacterium]